MTGKALAAAAIIATMLVWSMVAITLIGGW